MSNDDIQYQYEYHDVEDQHEKYGTQKSTKEDVSVADETAVGRWVSVCVWVACVCVCVCVRVRVCECNKLEARTMFAVAM